MKASSSHETPMSRTQQNLFFHAIAWTKWAVKLMPKMTAKAQLAAKLG
jgi:hypothetical protein